MRKNKYCDGSILKYCYRIKVYRGGNEQERLRDRPIKRWRDVNDYHFNQIRLLLIKCLFKYDSI